jgi:hypothetical protein
MRHTDRTLVVLAVLAALWAVVVIGCGGPAGGGASTPSASPPVAGGADITGGVRQFTRGRDGGGPTFLVVADSAAAGSVDQAFVRVTAKTIIWAPEGEGRRELSADDLAAGQRVAVHFTGPVAESYPVQAVAGAIEILSPL